MGEKVYARISLNRGEKDRKKETKKDTPTINCETKKERKKERKKEVFSKQEKNFTLKERKFSPLIQLGVRHPRKKEKTP